MSEWMAAISFRDLFLPLLQYLDSLVLSMLFINSLCYLVQMGSAFIELRRSQREAMSVSPWWLLTSRVTVPISIIVPAYNEEKTIVESVRSLLTLHYPNFEIVVVNDGSKDKTVEVIKEAYELVPASRVFAPTLPCKNVRCVYISHRYPKLTLVDKENGGKSDAFNAGLNLAKSPLVCMVDADSMLEPDALLRLVRPFVLEPDKVVAAGGKIRVVNGCEVRSGRVSKAALPTTFLPLIQTVEYIRSFQIARLSWSQMKTVTIISGAFGLFQRAAINKVGGYLHGTVGEDMEMTVKLHRYYQEQKKPYKVSYLSDPVCWTEVPTTLKILRSQRARWARGMLEVLMKHKAMIFHPRYGMPGMFGLGYFFLFDAVGPLIEFLGFFIIPICWLAGILNTPFFLAYLGLLFMFGVFVSVGSLFLEELGSTEQASPRDLFLLTLCAFAENFGYRQLNSFWRVQAWYQFVRKKKGWGKMVRTGFTKQPTQKPA